MVAMYIITQGVQTDSYKHAIKVHTKLPIVFTLYKTNYITLEMTLLLLSLALGELWAWDHP